MTAFEDGGATLKKKILWLAGIVIVLAVLLGIYFQPKPLSQHMREDGRIQIMVSKVLVENGETEMDTATYRDLTEAQSARIVELCDAYAYRRDWGTLFSDGSMSGLGDCLMYFYGYQGSELVEYVAVSSAGEVAVNGRTYAMPHAEEFLNQVAEILE